MFLAHQTRTKNYMVASDCSFFKLFLYYHCSDADMINKIDVLLKTKYMKAVNTAFFGTVEHPVRLQQRE